MPKRKGGAYYVIFSGASVESAEQWAARMIMSGKSVRVSRLGDDDRNQSFSLACLGRDEDFGRREWCATLGVAE